MSRSEKKERGGAVRFVPSSCRYCERYGRACGRLHPHLWVGRSAGRFGVFGLPLPSVLVDAVEFWDGFGVGIEWFVAGDGMSVLGVAAGEVMRISVDGERVFTESVVLADEWSTGGLEI